MTCGVGTMSGRCIGVCESLFTTRGDEGVDDDDSMEETICGMLSESNREREENEDEVGAVSEAEEPVVVVVVVVVSVPVPVVVPMSERGPPEGRLWRLVTGS